MKDTILINGIEIGPDTDVKDLLRRELLGGSALAGRHDETSEQSVWNLFSAAQGTAIESRLVDAVYHLLEDSDVRLRSGAAGLIQAYAESFDASRLLATMDRNPNNFEGVAPSSTGGPDLAWRLLRAIAAASHWNRDVVSRLRGKVLEVPNGINVLAALASRDSDWVIDHAADVIGNDKDRAQIVVFRLDGGPKREALARAISKESPKLRQLLRDAIKLEVKDSAERASLLQILY